MSIQRARTVVAAADPFLSIEAARPLLGRRGRPAARQTVLALGLRGELAIKQQAGRFVVSRDSVTRYREVHGIAG